MKPIPLFPGYFATEDGGIFSIKTNDPYKKVALDKPRQLKPKTTKQGYKMVVLTVDGNKYYRLVHQLILETFIGPRPAGMFACHGPKGNPDNSVSNLYWAEPKFNTLDRLRDGTLTRDTYTSIIINTANKNKGEDHKQAKLTDDIVHKIRELYRTTNITQTDLAKQFNVHTGTISKIILRTRWKHIP